jgi:hypothetical protein
MKRRQPQRCATCRKVIFRTRAIADAEVQAIVRRNLHIKKPGWLRAYRCEAGNGGWHIGHVPVAKKRRR